MKTIVAVIEKNEDSFFTYIPTIAGCVAGGNTYSEVKENLEEILQMFLVEDEELKARYPNGYKLKFEVDLESVFGLLPEINITQLANLGGINPGLLRQYVSGTKKASEHQTAKVMAAINKLVLKLKSLELTA
jgi:predicted RNase H-like HicB family nuclease